MGEETLVSSRKTPPAIPVASGNATSSRPPRAIILTHELDPPSPNAPQQECASSPIPALTPSPTGPPPSADDKSESATSFGSAGDSDSEVILPVKRTRGAGKGKSGPQEGASKKRKLK